MAHRSFTYLKPALSIHLTAVLVLLMLGGCGEKTEPPPEGTEAPQMEEQAEEVRETGKVASVPATPTPSAASEETAPPAPKAEVSMDVRVHATGKAIEGATVSWRLASSEAEPETALTDESGAVSIKSLQPGKYVVGASMPRYVPQSKRDVAVSTEKAPALLFELQPALAIRGRVVENITGRPIPKALVSAREMIPPDVDVVEEFPPILEALEPFTKEYPSREEITVEMSYQVHTNQEGRFVLDTLRKNRKYLVSAFSPDHISAEKEIELATDQTVDFTLDLGGSIEGVVQNAAGEAIPGATVSLLAPPEKESHRYDGEGQQVVSYDMCQTFTGPTNAFRFSALDTGEYFLKAWKDNLVTAYEPDPRHVEVTRGKKIEGLVVQLVAGGTLRARVTEHPSGKPLPDLPFLISNLRYQPDTGLPLRRARTDGNGTLLVSGLDRGEHTITCKSKAYRYRDGKSPRFEVAPGQTIELEIVLERTTHIAGWVLDPEGGPVAEAEVHLLEKTGPPFVQQFILRKVSGDTTATTGADGSFKIEGLKRDATYSVGVKAEGFPPKSVPDVPTGTEDLEIQLDPPGSISGRVVRSSGEAVRDGQVQAHAQRRQPRWQSGSQTSKTDPSGRYTLSGLGDGAYTVRAEAPNLAAQTKQNVRVEVGKETSGVDFVLETGVRITGRAVVQGTENGVPGVQIYASGEGLPGRRVETPVQTDASGQYVVENLSPGTYTLHVSAPEEGKPGYILASDEPQRKVLVKDEDVTGIDFEFVVGGTVRGKVLTPAGGPVADAKVTVSGGGGIGGFGFQARMTSVKVVESQSDGSYEVTGVPAGSGMCAIAGHEDYAPTRSAPFDLEAGEEKDGIDIRLTTGGAVSGKVTDEEKNPIPGVKIEGANLGEMVFRRIMGPAETETDAEGLYRLGCLPQGKVFLQASPPQDEKEYEQGSMLAVDVKEGEEVQNVDFVLRKKKKYDATIAGFVRNEKGEGIADCTLMAFMQDSGLSMETEGRHAFGQTSEDGSFEFTGLRKGKFDLQVLHVGYARGEKIEVEAPAENVEIVLKQCGSVSGTVVDGQTGEPVKSFEVSLKRETGGRISFMMMWPSQGTSFQSPDGSFQVADVDPGTYRATASAPGYGQGKSEPFEVEPGEDTAGIIIRIQEGGALVGIVASQNTYDPIADADVEFIPTSLASRPWLLISQGQGQYTARTDDSGTFVLEGLPTGEGELNVRHSAFAPKTEEGIEIGDGEVSEVRIFLGQGGAVFGRVISPDGQPLTSLAVSATRNDALLAAYGMGSGSRAVTDTNGEYLIEHLAPGSYTVALGEGTMRLLGGGESKPAQVKEGEITIVNFGGHQGDIYGMVTQAGMPATGLQVAVSSSSHPAAFFAGTSAIVDQNGDYRVENIPPGETKVYLQKPGAPFARLLRTVSVTMPEEGDLEVNLEVPGGRVEGSVVERSSGIGIASAKVILTPDFPDPSAMAVQMFSAREAVTDENGNFILEDTAGGTFRLEAAAQGYGQASLMLNLEEGESRTGIRLELPTPGSLAGHVSFPEDFDGAQTMVMMYLRRGEGEDSQMLSTVSGHQNLDENGNYRIDSLAPGTYVVSIQSLGVGSQTQSGVVIREGETTTLDFNLRNVFQVILSIRDSAGEPVYNPGVRILDSDGNPLLGSWLGLPLVNQDVIVVQLVSGVYTFILEKEGFQTREHVLDLSNAEGTYRGEIVLVLEE